MGLFKRKRLQQATRAQQPPSEQERRSLLVAGLELGADPRSTMRRCPDCAEQIQALARVCRFCGHRLEPSDGALTATAIIANEMNPPHVTAIALQGSGPLTAVAVESHPLPSDPPEVYLIDPDADEDTQLEYSGDEIRDISFSAADPERIVAVTWDGVVRVWEEPSGAPTLEISGESGHRSLPWFAEPFEVPQEITPVAAALGFGKDLLLGDDQGRVWRWAGDADGWRLLEAPGGLGEVQALQLTENGRLIVAAIAPDGGDGSGQDGVDGCLVVVWDAVTEALLWSGVGTGFGAPFAISPDGRRVIGFAQYDSDLQATEVCIFDVAEGALTARVDLAPGVVPDHAALAGDLLLINDGGLLARWRMP